MSELDDVLARFHRALVDEIRERRPEYLSGPFTVAEIYQNLVPYGSHREAIGVEMNGDYEDALLRLLAGHGGYLVLDSTPALRALQEELESPLPNTGIYREFAAVDVRLDPARVEGRPAAGGAPAPKDEPVSMADLAPNDEPPVESALEACRWCRAELPKRPGLNFCPFCGTDVNVVPCPECGEELDPDWRFCISCGTEIAS